MELLRYILMLRYIPMCRANNYCLPKVNFHKLNYKFTTKSLH